MEKVAQARNAREIEIVGCLWLQGGGDTKNFAVAKEYLHPDRMYIVVVAGQQEAGLD